MRSNFYYIILVLLFACTSCEELFEYHPNQIRLDSDERNLTSQNLARLQQQQPGDTLRLLVMGDTQRFYDDAADFVEAANKFTDIDFVIHQGDISDFGFAQEHKWVHDIMKKLKWPYLTVVGNHDLLANGSKVYQQMYGPLNYTFTYGHTKFVFVDTNGREYSFNGRVPDIAWLNTQLNQPSEDETYSQAIVVSHVPPYDGDFDPSLRQAYHNTLASSGKVQLSLFGHIHNWYTDTLYDNTITYHGTTTVKNRAFTYLRVWKDGYNIRRIAY